MINVKIEDLKDFLEKTKSFIKVVSFYVDKGGTGKSTHAFNFAGYCADVLKKRVLFIDGDRSCNSSDTFGVDGDLTIADIFKTGKYEIYHTNNKNIDIIVGSGLFTDEGVKITEASTNYMEFVRWLDNEKEFLDKEYDFIVIDTHNDESKVTCNLLVGSHLTVNVVSPDGDSFKAIHALSELIEGTLKPNTIPFRSKESIMDLDVAILPNLIPFNGNQMQKIAREFVEEVETMDGYIGLVPHKVEMKESRLVGENIFSHYERVSNKEKEKMKDFVQNLKEIYARIAIVACKKALESE
jgi:CobQ/CobB/MinD/ParA nucleotide binding domain.